MKAQKSAAKVERQMMAEKRKEEKRLMDEEKRRKREVLEKEREAKRQKLEMEKQERLEEKNARKRLKDEERQKKEEERQKKEEEKQKKEEERQRKLEEKRLQEEEKLKKQAEEIQKKEKLSQHFMNFFVKTPKISGQSEQSLNISGSQLNTSISEPFQNFFLPFQLQPHQTIANPVPDFVKQRFAASIMKFDELFANQIVPTTELYLGELGNGYKPYRYVKNDRECCSSPEIIIENNESSVKYRAKLLQFDASNRPPYYGTWRKKSTSVTGRRPFGNYPMFNYEIDSDDEWEEEEEGESIKDNDSEMSVEENDGYEMDEMFVSHGYLSDDEKEEEDTDGLQTRGVLSKEHCLTEGKKKLSVKQLTPIVIGCCWKSSGNETEDSFTILEGFKATYLTL